MSRYVWVITDQADNHRCHHAFVESLANGRAKVVHVHVKKEQLTSTNAPSVRTRLRARAGATWTARDPVLLFRDSECTDQAMLARARSDMESLEEQLRQTTPHVCGVVFNPMSEGALLLFPTARSILGAEFQVELPESWIDDKRFDRFVHKQQLDRALDLANHTRKRALDQRMAADVPSWLPTAEPVFTRVTARLRAVLDAALGVP